MTEATSMVSAVPVDEPGTPSRKKPGSIGVPLHNVAMKVRCVGIGLGILTGSSNESLVNTRQ